MEALKGKYKYEAQDPGAPIARDATSLPKKRRKVKLTGKEAKIEWTLEMVESFQILKDKLVKFVDGDGLWLPNPHGKWTIVCDTSDYAVGGVLEQQQNPQDEQSWRPVAFYSRKL